MASAPDAGGAGTIQADTMLFNPFMPEMRTDPYPAYHLLRAADPVHRVPLEIGPQVWILSRHRDVSMLLRDSRVSSDRRKSDLYEAFLQSLPEELRTEELVPSMLFLDPPDHTRLRSLVNQAFTGRVIEQLRPRVEEMVAALLDDVAAVGRMDVIEELAYPLPVNVICDLLGVAEMDRELLRRWSLDLIYTLDPMVPPEVLGRAQRAGAEFREYLRALIAERRSSPGPDLLSALIAAEDEGGRLSEGELVSTCVLLLIAGHETTSGLIGNGTLALLRNADQLRRWNQEPGIARPAVEELLRYDSPVQLTGRLLVDDIEVDGRTLPKGSEVVGLLGAANRDPDQFPDPDRLDLGRKENRHIAFGSGIHFCLGAALARVEGQVALGQLVRRFPDMSLAGDPVWRDTITLRGLRSLPVSLA
ncbi:MAG: cytochrome P450 [Actinomycetota bacterium]|nr:cytochrome P450 [Actinomycetota bacterium]